MDKSSKRSPLEIATSIVFAILVFLGAVIMIYMIVVVTQDDGNKRKTSSEDETRSNVDEEPTTRPGDPNTTQARTTVDVTSSPTTSLELTTTIPTIEEIETTVESTTETTTEDMTTNGRNTTSVEPTTEISTTILTTTEDPTTTVMINTLDQTTTQVATTVTPTTPNPDIVLTLAVDNSIEVWIDGVSLGTHTGWFSPPMTVPLPDNAGVLSFKAHNSGGEAGVLASMTNGMVTEANGWRCTATEPAGDVWKSGGFDDSAWSIATEYGANGVSPWGPVNNIAATAKWIWTSGHTGAVGYIYCRMRIDQTTTHMPTVNTTFIPTTTAEPLPCPITLTSAGFSDPGYNDNGPTVGLDYGQTRLNSLDISDGRGIFVVQFDRYACAVLNAVTFDIYSGSAASNNFVAHMNNMPIGATILLMTGDEYTSNLGTSGRAVLLSMQSQVTSFAYRSSLAVVSVKTGDGTYCNVATGHNDRYQGPTRVDVTMDTFLNNVCYGN